MPVAWRPDDPLARVPGESRRANQALRAYAEQHGQRSLRRLAEEFARALDEAQTRRRPTPSLGTITGWSVRFEWQARVARYDELEAARVAALRAEAERAEIARWAARRQELREREWSLSSELAQRVATMLKTPLFRTETDGGKTIIMPARWNWSDVARLADTVSRLARLAAELPTERSTLALEEMSDADLAAAIAAAIGAIVVADPGSPPAEPGPDGDCPDGPGAGPGTGALSA